MKSSFFDFDWFFLQDFVSRFHKLRITLWACQPLHQELVTRKIQYFIQLTEDTQLGKNVDHIDDAMVITMADLL